jgi:hypothetical protein
MPSGQFSSAQSTNSHAISNAASDPSESSQLSTDRATENVRRRRMEEAKKCPPGFEVKEGACRPLPTSGWASSLLQPTPSLTRPAVFSTWTSSFGDYEFHSNIAPGSSNDTSRTTKTGGALAGADVTLRSIASETDGLILGVLTGYSGSWITFANMAPSARIEGPSAAIYGTYFNGGLSTELTLKLDLYAMSQGTSESNSVPSTNIPMQNYTGTENLYYKLPFGRGWIEPTLGLRYTYTQYGGGAASLGLANGQDWRFQGGARIGTDTYWNGMRVTLSVLGLLYDDAIVNGFVVDNAGLGPGILPADEGKLRIQGALSANIDYGNGWSAFTQLDVRGGTDLFGVGGKLGLKYIWSQDQ